MKFVTLALLAAVAFAQEEPADPVDPADPADPVDPEEPVDPEAPVEPEEPAEPPVPGTPEADLDAPALVIWEALNAVELIACGVQPGIEGDITIECISVEGNEQSCGTV